MTAYAIILLLTAVIFGLMAVLIYGGKTNLIHDYHQAKVTDKTAYGKAFGKAMGVIAGAMALSGIITIVRVQKKYNGGVFA